MDSKCFACGRPTKKEVVNAFTSDGQVVAVGADCFKKIAKAGDAGYQPPKGGPRLYK